MTFTESEFRSHSDTSDRGGIQSSQEVQIHDLLANDRMTSDRRVAAGRAYRC